MIFGIGCPLFLVLKVTPIVSKLPFVVGIAWIKFLSSFMLTLVEFGLATGVRGVKTNGGIVVIIGAEPAFWVIVDFSTT